MKASLQAIEAVYRDSGEAFFRLALARTDDPERARDAVQEGFARAIRSRHTYRGSGPLEAWIARCVINAAHDASAARIDAGGSRADYGDTAGTARTDPDAERVRDALRHLPQRQRDALFLRFYLDLDYAAIAEVLGVEVGTVSAALHAARASLARTLEEVPR